MRLFRHSKGSIERDEILRGFLISEQALLAIAAARDFSCRVRTIDISEDAITSPGYPGRKF